MNTNKVIKLIDSDVKKGLPPKRRYYRDENSSLWIGHDYAVYRLDGDVVFTKDWLEQDMQSIISRHVMANNISLTNIQIKGVWLSNMGKYTELSVFLADEAYLLAQTKYVEMLEKEEGHWEYNGGLLFFIQGNP
ncbi:MAG TPA: hypothetical protein VN441_04195 [Syntrophomonas sp.]|nr:hypothetical protein [Syntrophomonas sp.]